MSIAAKWGDPVLGVDCHMVNVPTPGGPVPTPLPHPFVGVVFDPLGAAMGALGGVVLVNGMPCGNVGTEIEVVPHFPTPPGVGPAPMDAPPGNEGSLVSGSKTVLFAGGSESRTLSHVLSCNYPFDLPTSVCMSVPMGAPVMIGGPEAIDFAAVAIAAIRSKWMSNKLHGLLGATQGSKRSKVICALTGHPVDVMTGELIADAIDAELPGLIPVTFERNYRSRESEPGLLGPSWYHFFDAYIEDKDGATQLRLADGRPATHPRLTIGQSYFHAPDRYTVIRERDGYDLLEAESGLRHVFRQTDATGRCRLVELRDRGGNVVTLRWRGRYLVDLTDTADRRVEARYTREGRLERLVFLEKVGEGTFEHLLTRYAYSDDGRLAAVFDPMDQAMRYEYRGGVLTREVHKSGLTFHFEWDQEDPTGWCVRTWGDAGDSDPAVMDLAPGATPPIAIYDRRISYAKQQHRTLVKDGRGGITVYEGNALDLVDKITDAAGLVTETTWNQHAWKTAETDGTGARWEWEYDERGNQVLERDPLGQETRRTFDVLDRLTSVVDAKGGEWSVEYDRTDNPKWVRRPDGSATLIDRDVRGRAQKITNAMGQTTRLTWTSQHTLASEVDPMGRTTEYRHDALGRLVGSTDPLGRELRIQRNPNGDPIHAATPDGEEHAITVDAEGNVVEHSDSRGRKQRMRYAGMGRLVEHFDAQGYRLRLRYNGEEDLVAVENQAGELYTFDLDLAGKVKEERTFSGTRRQFVYDKAGRLKRLWTAGYRTIDFERDPLGQVLRRVSKTARFGDKPVEELFTYDPLGALLSARTPGGETTLERDVLGRVTRESELVPATGTTADITSRYDPIDQRVERVSSLMQETTYDWNPAGELTGVSAGWALSGREQLRKLGIPQARMGSFDIRFARDALGQELARRLPGGVAASWARDRLGRPTEQRVVVGASPQSAGRGVLDRRFGWVAPDQIGSIIDRDPASGATRGGSTYEYDPRGFLIRQLFSNGETLHRHADATGNLFKSADGSDRVYAKGGVLRRNGATELEHDKDGFLIKKTLADGATWRYHWDAHGRLAEVHRPDGKTAAFTYDAFGRRTTKTFDGRTAEYLWDGDDLIHERVRDADGATSPLTTWVFEPGTFTPLAKLEGRRRFGIVGDHLGCPTLLTTEAGRIAWRAQLDIYGVPREETGLVDAEECTENPWRFPGQYEDKETGLYYNRFRYYDPETGRYLSEDPIGLEGGEALYGYVHEPLGWIDPFGLNVSTGAGRDHVTYRGTKGGKAYTGYASAPSSLGLTPDEIVARRYGGDFSAFKSRPVVAYHGQGVEGKRTARGLEQHWFEEDVKKYGRAKVANAQNPVGKGNKNREKYRKAANKHLCGK
ncbi:MAG: RHS repeat-associated core domain-containing protein [Polyangiaceae bacterium]